MPQIGHVPGSLRTISGCIGQVYMASLKLAPSAIVWDVGARFIVGTGSPLPVSYYRVDSWATCPDRFRPSVLVFPI